MQNDKTVGRTGQAMIEAMIGVILILILVAGTVQFVDVARAHYVIDSRIRGDAGVIATSPPLPLASPDIPAYILTWTPGVDGQRNTADDQAVLGPATTLYHLADHSTRATVPSDWNTFNDLATITGHGSSVINLHQSPVQMSELGFVGVYGKLTVPISSLVQSLFYSHPDVVVREVVWVPVTRDLY